MNLSQIRMSFAKYQITLEKGVPLASDWMCLRCAVSNRKNIFSQVCGDKVIYFPHSGLSCGVALYRFIELNSLSYQTHFVKFKC